MASQPQTLAISPESGMETTVPIKLPEKAMVANLLLSRGGAHLDQTAWMQGKVTPYRN